MGNTFYWASAVTGDWETFPDGNPWSLSSGSGESYPGQTISSDTVFIGETPSGGAIDPTNTAFTVTIGAGETPTVGLLQLSDKYDTVTLDISGSATVDSGGGRTGGLYTNSATVNVESGGTLTSDGYIEVDSGGSLNILAGGSLDLEGTLNDGSTGHPWGSFTNNGAVDLMNNATITGAVTNKGNIQVMAGQSATITGAVSGLGPRGTAIIGTETIDRGSSLTLDSAVASGQDVDFQSAGFAGPVGQGLLVLNDPTGFKGEIVGMGPTNWIELSGAWSILGTTTTRGVGGSITTVDLKEGSTTIGLKFAAVSPLTGSDFYAHAVGNMTHLVYF